MVRKEKEERKKERITVASVATMEESQDNSEGLGGCHRLDEEESRTKSGMAPQGGSVPWDGGGHEAMAAFQKGLFDDG